MSNKEFPCLQENLNTKKKLCQIKLLNLSTFLPFLGLEKPKNQGFPQICGIIKANSPVFSLVSDRFVRF